MKKEKITDTVFLGSSEIYQGKKHKKAPMYEQVSIGKRPDSRKYPVIYMVSSLNERKYLCWNLKRKPTKEEIAIVGRAPDSRTWGWVPTFAEAEEAVKGNAGDMAECCYYTHVLIEKVMCGIPFFGMDEKNETWYKWHVDPKDPHKFRGKWKKCAKPDWSKSICSWSVG